MIIQRFRRAVPGVSLLMALLILPSAHAIRVKDVADVAGVRSNHLVGYGLVVGLPGTGDKLPRRLSRCKV